MGDDGRLDRKEVGGYFIESLLGRGSMGEAYLARKPGGRPLVIKLLREDLLSERMIARFRREIRLAKKMRSPYVATVRGSGVDRHNRPWVAFDYMEGETLLARLRADGILPFEEVSWILDHILQGLEHAHALGVIHRDVKPSNIIVRRRRDGSECATIIDFGVATAQDETLITRTGDTLGNTTFAAPEQLDTPSEVDHRADLYSVGVLGFQALSGTLPFEGDTPIMHRYYKRRYEPLTLAQATGTVWPANVEEFFRTMMARAPEKRFPDARAARAAWNDICAQVEER